MVPNISLSSSLYVVWEDLAYTQSPSCASGRPR
jgi:hypothetical protein